jgi:RNA-binding protein
MRRLGEVLHVSKRGALIVRTDKTPPIGRESIVLDKKANRVGTVVDVFGPVKNPYVSIRPYKKMNSQSLIGQMLYLEKRKK